ARLAIAEADANQVALRRDGNERIAVRELAADGVRSNSFLVGDGDADQPLVKQRSDRLAIDRDLRGGSCHAFHLFLVCASSRHREGDMLRILAAVAISALTASGALAASSAERNMQAVLTAFKANKIKFEEAGS